MRLQVHGRNVEVTETLREYAEQKLGKLERQLHDLTRVELELAVERNPSIAENQIAEATIWTKGPVLRARESNADMRAAIDQLLVKLERQVTRYREKRQRRNGRADGRPIEPAQPVENVAPRIVKTKQFVLSPMTAEEAVEALELVGHDFFVFRDSESNVVEDVFRRRDGSYGLIEPA
jgi:putative sigma-54 modulation protein